MTCTVHKGDIPLQISWTHNSHNITPSAGVAVSRTSRRNSQLSIDSVQASHAGEYTCQAKNKAGTAAFSAVLNVNGEFMGVSVAFFVLVFIRFLFVYQSPR